jgi:hypothetical protein
MAYLINFCQERYLEETDYQDIYEHLKNIAVKNKKTVNFIDCVDFRKTKWEICNKNCTKEALENQTNELKKWILANKPEFKIENLCNIEQCNKMVLAFYNDEIWGLYEHPAQLNNESEFILDELKLFTKTKFIPVDSQPGLVFNDRNYIQMPYIGLISQKKNFDELFKIMSKSCIGVVEKYTNKFDYFGLSNDNVDEENKYCMYMFGICPQRIPIEELESYIFTNKFFVDILNMISLVK